MSADFRQASSLPTRPQPRCPLRALRSPSRRAVDRWPTATRPTTKQLRLAGETPVPPTPSLQTPAHSPNPLALPEGARPRRRQNPAPKSSLGLRVLPPALRAHRCAGALRAPSSVFIAYGLRSPSLRSDPPPDAQLIGGQPLRGQPPNNCAQRGKPPYPLRHPSKPPPTPPTPSHSPRGQRARGRNSLRSGSLSAIATRVALKSPRVGRCPRSTAT